jgi:hypothetical protein
MSYRDSVPFGRASVTEVYRAMTRGERIWFWVAIVNFVVFVAIAVPLGGDALNGTARDGHYYLMQHGIYTEVRRSIFIYSTIHTLSLFVTQPLGIVVALRARFRARD